jgi:hypothetical protein
MAQQQSSSDSFPGVPVSQPSYSEAGGQQWPGTIVSTSSPQQQDPGFLSNVGTSAVRAGEGIVQPFIHPIETAKGLGQVGAGAASMLGVPGLEQYQPAAAAVGKFYADRYGGWDNFKKTLYEDPVGAVLDLSTIAMPFEMLPGKVGTVAGVVSRAPTLAAKIPGAVGKGVAEVGGLMTGKGSEAIRGVAREAAEGRGEEVAKNLRQPDVYAPDVVAKARSALAAMYREKSTNYEQFHQQFDARSLYPLDFKDIDAAIARNEDVGKFRGVDVAQLAGENEKTDAQRMLDSIKHNVNHWRTLPDFYRTAPGIDKLKQHIGDKINWKTGSDAANKVAQDIYHAVRDTIAKQDKKYSEAMKDYQEATDLIQNVERTLSLSKKAPVDTTLRKLLSTQRSNVNTNFGQRLKLAEELNKRDPTIMAALQGQTLAPWTPGGVQGAALGSLGALEIARQGAINPKALLSMVPAAVASSPRLWGEGALAAGKARSAVPQAIIDAARRSRGVADLLYRLGLASRAAGGQNAPQ